MWRYTFLIIMLIMSCKRAQNTEVKLPFSHSSENQEMEAITLMGDTLLTPLTNPKKALENLELAEQRFNENPNSTDAMIWYGRRTAYLGQFQKSITIYSDGILKFPNDARFYRHRGHRYISTRQYDKAISDFEKAAELIKGQPEQVEPDGLPNDRNIPLSTLQGNIWYHLGLAHYLKNDMPNAFKAYQNRAVTNRYDDNLVSGGHWLFMISKRLGMTDEAEKAIEKVEPGMDIIENTSYYNMCLFYKGLISEQDLNINEVGTSSNDVYLYGLANWYLYEKNDTIKAQSLFKKLLADGNHYSFAYLAAESDWKRLFTE